MVFAGGLVLGGYVWFGDAGRHESVARHRIDRLLLPDGIETLTTITFRRGDSKVLIERMAGGWVYVGGQPCCATSNADSSSFIDARVRMLSTARIERDFSLAAIQPKHYGIDAKSVRIELAFLQPEERSWILAIGGRTPDGFGQYLHFEGTERIITLPAYHIDNLLRLYAHR
jgi:hypothetical protein